MDNAMRGITRLISIQPLPTRYALGRFEDASRWAVACSFRRLD